MHQSKPAGEEFVDGAAPAPEPPPSDDFAEEPGINNKAVCPRVETTAEIQSLKNELASNDCGSRVGTELTSRKVKEIVDKQ